MMEEDSIPESGPIEGYEHRNYSDFIVDRVDNFQDKFGARHLYLAMHAAFPVSLPPELLYLIRENFQYDSKGNFLDIPFESVPDLLLSEMCQEVGHEVYQMEPELRQYLLKRLRESSRFGEERLKILGDFIAQYYGPDLSGGDLDSRNVAESQLWASNLQTDSSQGVSQLSELLEFAQDEGDNNLQYRLNNLLNQYEVPEEESELLELQELKNFAKGNALNLMGLKEEANNAFSKLQQTTSEVQIGGRGFDVPEIDVSQKLEVPDLGGNQIDTRQFDTGQFDSQTLDTQQLDLDGGGLEQLDVQQNRDPEDNESDQKRARFLKAIRIFRKEVNQSGLADALNNLAELEVEAGNIDQARNAYLELIELYERQGDEAGLKRASESLLLLQKAEDFDRQDIQQKGAFDDYEQGEVNEILEEEDEGPKIWLVHHSEDIGLAKEIVKMLEKLGFPDVVTSPLDLFDTMSKYKRGFEDGIVILEGIQGGRWIRNLVQKIDEMLEGRLILGNPERVAITGHPKRKDEFPQLRSSWSVFDVNTYESNPMWLQFAARVRSNFEERTRSL